MTSHLNITSVSVGASDKETTINNAIGALDAAITAELTVTWAADTLIAASDAQTREHAIFVMAGTPGASPVFKFGNVQRGVVVFRNGTASAIDVKDYSSSTTINVSAGNSVAFYVTAAGIYTILAAGGTSSSSTTDVLTGSTTGNYVTPDALAALWEKGSAIASASTISIGEGGYFHVTGTTTINDIDFATATNGRAVVLEFDGILTLTHNATTLKLPGGADITTAAGDTCVVIQDSGDNVRVAFYQRADGTAVNAGAGASAASTTEVLTGTDTSKAVTPDALAALWEQGADIASAATITIGEGGYFHITGTTGITDIDFGTDKTGRKVRLVFDGILTLTHSSTLILPTAANITTAAGDTCEVVSEGTDTVRITNYQRASGAALVGSTSTASTTEVLTGTDTTKAATADAIAALWEQGASVASASTISLGEGGYFSITGTTTITDIDFATDKAGRRAVLVFAGSLILTHNATTLILPTGADITTAAGDVAEFVSEGSDVVRCINYRRADGTALATTGSFTAASTTDVLTGTDTTKGVTADALAAIWEKGSDVASAATVSLGEGGFFHITGTTTITDIDWATAKDGRAAYVTFDGALTLTHNATTLKLPSGANITTAAGDRAIFVQDASDNVICIGYFRASGKPVIPTTQTIAIACSDESTAITTGTAKTTFRMPYAFTLTEIRASVTTAPTGAAIIIDVNEGGSTLMTTNKCTIDVSTKSTKAAGTQPTLTDTSLADDAEITIDFDQVGSTIAGAGVKVYLIGYPTNG